MSTKLPHRFIALLLGATASLTMAAPLDGGLTDLQNSLAGKIIGIDAAPVLIARPGVASLSSVNALLAGPLSANAAVRIALLNNPELQMALGSEPKAITDLEIGRAHV